MQFNGFVFFRDLLVAGLEMFVLFKANEGLRPLAFSMLSLLVHSLASVLNGNWWRGVPILLVVDLLALILASWGLWRYQTDGLEVGLRLIATLVYLVDGLVVSIAFLVDLTAMLSNYLGGVYCDSLSATPPFFIEPGPAPNSGVCA